MLEKINEINQKTARIQIYSCNTKAPLIWFNSPTPPADELLQMLERSVETPFHLIFCYGMNWDNALTPWPMGPTVPGDLPCAGEADSFITWIEQQYPSVTKGLQISETILAGYSLSGLFAFYAFYKTSLFNKACCMSGSFWYPDFVDYAKSHPFVKEPQSVFFSLGKAEAKSPNPWYRQVQVKTEELFEYVKKLNIPTVFILEPGNHFQHVFERIVRGFQWILTH